MGTEPSTSRLRFPSFLRVTRRFTLCRHALRFSHFSIRPYRFRIRYPHLERAVAGPAPAQPAPHMAVNDFDNDGRADLLIADYSLNTTGLDTRISLFHGLAGQVFGPESVFVGGSGVQSLLTGDLNHDGRPDIVASNGDFNAVANAFTVLLNEGSGPTVSGVLTSAPEPSAYGQPFTVTATLTPSLASAKLSGSVLFWVDNATPVSVALTGNAASLVVASALSVGVHQLAAATVNLTDGTNAYPVQALTSQHTVLPLQVGVTLTASLATASVGQPITFFAAVVNPANSPSSSPAPTGKLTFLESNLPFASGSVAGTTGVTFSASQSFSTPGAHTITVTYSGDSSHVSGSASITVQVIAVAVPTIDDFKIALSPNSVTVKSGQGALTSVALSGIGAYEGTLNLSFGPLPTNGSARFDSASVGLATGSVVSSSLTIGTYSVPVRTAALDRAASRQPALLVAIVGLGLGLLRRRRRGFKDFSLAFIFAALLGSMTGCTTSFESLNLVAPGTYTIPVTATDSLTGTTHTAALTLVVQ